MQPAIAPSKDLIPMDDLDQAIVNLSARINAETYELLILIRQNPPAGGLLSGVDNFVSEPPPPTYWH